LAHWRGAEQIIASTQDISEPHIVWAAANCHDQRIKSLNICPYAFMADAKLFVVATTKLKGFGL